MSTTVAELPDLYEVVNGQVVEQSPMSAKSTVSASRIMRMLSNYSEAQNLGEAFTELLIAMPDRFEHNRRPDVSYISYAKWPKGKEFSNESALEIVPDLCVEVVSPSDSADELKAKIDEYFEAGVTMVWVVYPNRRYVEVYDSPDHIRMFRTSDTLTGGSVIPGFALPLTQLFPGS